MPDIDSKTEHLELGAILFENMDQADFTGPFDARLVRCLSNDWSYFEPF
jgi:hypothetical protein